MNGEPISKSPVEAIAEHLFERDQALGVASEHHTPEERLASAREIVALRGLAAPVGEDFSDAPSHANPSSPLLRRLLERVEAATGADRSLDDAISRFDPTYALIRVHPYISGTLIDDAKGGVLHETPAYTASLDAALALVGRVLPGWVWVVCAAEEGATASLAPKKWQPWRDVWPDDVGGADASAPTPALAACAALLKVVQAQAPTIQGQDGATPRGPFVWDGGPPALTLEEYQRLSRAFHRAADLRDDQDRRINEWLKHVIASKANFRAAMETSRSCVPVGEGAPEISAEERAEEDFNNGQFGVGT